MYGAANTTEEAADKDRNNTIDGIESLEESVVVRSAPAPVDPSLRQAQKFLYASHFVAELANGTWQFAVILFLDAVTNYQSVLLVTTYTMVSYASVFGAGAHMGSWIDDDTTPRLQTARKILSANNASVIVASLACCWLLVHTGGGSRDGNGKDGTADNATNSSVPSDWLSLVLIVVIHILGSVAEVLDQAFAVLVERDWIVAMSPSTEWLTETNVTLRQIDLGCKVMAPTLAGWIVEKQASRDHMCDLHGAAVLVGIFNAVALVTEYVCTTKIYYLVPALAISQRQKLQCDTCPTDSDVDESSSDDNEEEQQQTVEAQQGSGLFYGLRVYMKQSVAWAGLSFAFLWVNTLSFGGIMTTYLLWRGLPLDKVGLWRGISSVSALAGTLVYPYCAKFLTVVEIGQLSITFLFVCVAIAMIAFYFVSATSNGVMMVVFLVALCASRIGLWVFDVVIALLMQEFVPAGSRGLVGGTQKSINSFFTLAASSLGLYFSKPEQFYVFASSSFCAIGVALVTYTLGVFQQRRYFLLAVTDEVND